MGRVLFAGGRLESVKVLAGGPADDGSTGYDAAYSDASLRCGPGDIASHKLYDDAMAITTITAGHVAFFHCLFYWQNDPFHGPTQYPWQIFDASGYQWFRFLYDGGLTCQVQASPGVWTTLGTPIGLGVYQGTLDFAVTIDAGGNHHASLYKDNTLTTIDADFTAAGLTNLAEVRYSGTYNFYPSYASQMLVTEDLPTIAAHVKTTRGTAAGTYADWSGTVSGVNEVGDDDTTGNSATVEDAKTTYPMGNITVPAGYVIPTVFHWLRGKETGGDPGNIKSMARSAGVDAISGNLAGIGLGYAALGFRYNDDPATGTPWTQASWNAPVQLGFESAA